MVKLISSSKILRKQTIFVQIISLGIILSLLQFINGRKMVEDTCKLE